MTPEFSRLVRIDTLGAAPVTQAIEADPAERAALARRFGLLAIERLTAEAALTRGGAVVIATGRLSAGVTQSCVATGEAVPGNVDEAFRIEFRPPPDRAGADEEVELSESELDVVFYEGGSVDLGEAVAETLSLNLEPYPRCAQAEAALREAGVKSEEEARAESSPFAVLKGLTGKTE